MKLRRRSAVSAALGALLMIAIAVSLSVALFGSMTGYLGSLVNGGSNQQPGQSRAEETLLSIENAQAKAYSSGYPTDGYAILYVRNVGGTAVTLGSITLTPPPTNGGLKKSFSSILSSTGWAAINSTVLVSSEATSVASCGVAGTASGSGETTGTLVDSGTPNWTVNQWAGYTVTITAGKDVGQSKPIASNTATTLTITGTWTAAPDGTSVYAINPAQTLTTLGIQQTTRLCITWSSGASPHPVSGDVFQVQVNSNVGTSSIVTVSVP